MYKRQNARDAKEHFDFARLCVACGAVGCVASAFTNVSSSFASRDADWESSRREAKEARSGGMASTVRRLYTPPRCADETLARWFAVPIEYKIIGTHDRRRNPLPFYWREVASSSAGDRSCARRMWSDLRSRLPSRLVSSRSVAKRLRCDLKLIDVGARRWGRWCHRSCRHPPALAPRSRWDASTPASAGTLKSSSRIRNRTDSLRE